MASQYEEICLLAMPILLTHKNEINYLLNMKRKDYNIIIEYGF